jgi:hypothetical protein
MNDLDRAGLVYVALQAQNLSLENRRLQVIMHFMSLGYPEAQAVVQADDFIRRNTASKNDNNGAGIMLGIVYWMFAGLVSLHVFRLHGAAAFWVSLVLLAVFGVIHAGVHENRLEKKKAQAAAALTRTAGRTDR